MASTYTSRLGLERQADGENSSTWGARLVSGVIDLVDFAIAGLTSVALSSAPITLTDNDGTADQSRASILYLHGTLTSNCQVVVPSVTKPYSIYNACTGNFNPIIKTAGGAGSSVPRSGLSTVFCDSVSVWIDRTSIGNSVIMSATTVGTVTSIGVSAGAGVSVTGSPITSSGSLAIILDINKLTADTAPNPNADYLPIYSVSAAAPRKTLLSEVGKIAQIVAVQDGAVATGTTVMPFDNTIPQNTEGDQYMSLSITPTNATSILQIDVVWIGANSGGFGLTAALFQDSTANALGAVSQQPVAAGSLVNLKFTHRITAGTTAATTFKVRAGPANSATTTFNGTAGAGLFGGTLRSSIIITEILP